MTAARTTVMLLLTAFLFGCAGYRAYHKGNELLAKGDVDAGLEKLSEAVQREPHSIEYRVALSTKRFQAVSELLLSADTALREGRLSDAEGIYRHVQRLDPGNAMARQGLNALLMERRHRKIITTAEADFSRELSRGAAADLPPIADALRKVLAENPRQPDALNLQARLEEAQAKQQQPAAQLAALYRKSVTLEFRDAPIKTVFDAIAKVSGLNFFFDKDIRPDLKASVLAKNTSIEDAIRMVLVTNQLEQKVLNQNSVLIYPNTPQKLKDYQTLSLRTFFLANAEVKSIANTLKTLLKAQDLVVDERLGLIMMRDTPEVVRLAEKLIALQDVSDPEVMLDVEVLEIKRGRLTQLGVDWPQQATLAPLVSSGQSLTLEQLLHLNSKTISASIGTADIKGSTTDDDADILANPRIRVRNKDTARVLIGDRVPVITTTSTSTGFVSDSVSYVDVGLKLEAEPNIYLDQEVGIKIHLEVSNIVKEVTSKSGTLAYQIGTRTADTVLRLRDGETQILAGLISDEDRASANKVPALGNLPILGRLFGSRTNDHQRSEIVLSITPHVLRSLHRPDLIAAEFESGTQTTIGARNLAFSTVEPEKGAPDAAGASGGASGGAAPKAAPEASPMLTPVEKAVPPQPEPNAAVPPADVSVPNATPPAGEDARSHYDIGSLTWQLPKQVKAGEQFTAVLRIRTDMNIHGLPMLIGFDPQVLQVVNVNEGDFLRQGGGHTDFNKRVDPVQGKLFLAAVRQSPNGADRGISGTGSLVAVTFKAVKPAEQAQVLLHSIAPDPQPSSPVALPVAASVKIVK